MAIYSVMIGPGPATGKGTRLIREGFSWMSFFFPELWLAGKGLWTPALFTLSLHSLITSTAAFGLDEAATTAMLLALHLIVGFEGNGLLRWSLTRRGYRETAIIEAGSLEQAEYRWFAGQGAGAA